MRAVVMRTGQPLPGVRCDFDSSLVLTFRVPGADLSAAAENEAGQESVRRGVRDWPGAAERRPPRRIGGGPGSGAEDRHVQPQVARLGFLRAQQCLLVIGQHREKHSLHATRPGGGQDLR